ncbi:MAG: hypothetical protein AB8B51_09495 [Sedimentitalea sp.]
MAMVNEYTKVQAKFTKAVTDLECSELFSSFRRADKKVVDAMKTLDKLSGKTAADMIAAAKNFGSDSTPYLSKLEKQAKKEKNNSKLIIKELTKFQVNLSGLLHSYLKDAEKLDVAQQQAGATQDARGKGKDATQAAADKVNDKKLVAAIKSFNERRDKHLKGSEKVLANCQKAAAGINTLRTKAASALGAAEKLAANGQPEGALKSAVVLNKLVANAERVAEASSRNHTTELKDKFQKERSMNFRMLKKEFDLPDSMEKAFLKNQKAKVKIFSMATDNGKAALELISQMRVEAADIASMAKQASAAAEGGEKLLEFVVSDLTSGGSSGGGLVEKAISEYGDAVDKMDRGIERVAAAVKRARANTDPSQTAKLTESAQTFGSVLSDTENTAQRKWVRVDTTFKNLQRKVPKQFINDPKVKDALNGMLQKMAKIKGAHAKHKKIAGALDKMLDGL